MNERNKVHIDSAEITFATVRCAKTCIWRCVCYFGVAQKKKSNSRKVESRAMPLYQDRIGNLARIPPRLNGLWDVLQGRQDSYYVANEWELHNMGFCMAVLLLWDVFRWVISWMPRQKLTRYGMPLPGWEDYEAHGLLFVVQDGRVPPMGPDHKSKSATDTPRRKPHHFAISNNSSLQPLVRRFNWSTVIVVVWTGYSKSQVQVHYSHLCLYGTVYDLLCGIDSSCLNTLALLSNTEHGKLQLSTRTSRGQLLAIFGGILHSTGENSDWALMSLQAVIR